VFWLGGLVEFIRQSDSGTHEVKGKGWLVENLHWLSHALNYCQIKDESLSESIEEWTTRLERNYKKGMKISKQDGKELSDEADHWENLIFKELCARPCIEYQEGALNQRALMLTSEGKPSDIFDKKIWKRLPKIAQSDFSDSAKCLLIGASTPATMVALRGTEAVIRAYYSQKTNRDATKKTLGTIIKELRQVRGINEKLISFIDYIRSERRNIALHPDKMFSQREAERIFMEIVSVTHDIYAKALM